MQSLKGRGECREADLKLALAGRTRLRVILGKGGCSPREWGASPLTGNAAETGVTGF